MEENGTSKNAPEIAHSGESSSGPGEKLTPHTGGDIKADHLPDPVKNNETTLAFADAGSQQDTSLAEQADNSAPKTAPALAAGTLPVNQTADSAIDDIAALQDLIESGDDIELPDTAAGGLTGNEGTNFVTLDRTGNETLARAGYDTTEQENSLLPRDNPQSGSSQPTITQSDENIAGEDQTVTGNVLDNDSDGDDILTVQFFTVDGDTTVYAGGQTAIVEGGSLTINNDGSYSFIPAANWNGTLPVVSYTTNTNASDTLTITLTPVSDLSDEDESASTNEDTALSGNVLANAASSDGIPEVLSFTLAGTDFEAGTTAIIEQGALTLNRDGSYTFIPADNFNGDVPDVAYTVSDGPNTDTSTLAIEVLPVSDLSDADETATTNEDTPINGNVLANASSTDGIPEVTGFIVNNTNFTAGASATLEEGVLTLTSDGSYSFVPGENFNGDVPIVIYTVFDGINTETSTLTLEVLPVSDLSDEDETVSTNEDTPINGNVLANAASADGIPEVTGFIVNNTNFAAGTQATLEEGVLTLNSDGSYSFIPGENYNGDVPIVTYTVFDGINTETSTLAIEVLPVSDLSDEDETLSTNEDTTINGNVLDNAASADGIPEVTGFIVNNTNFAAGASATLEEGVLTLNSDGSYAFIPGDNFNGNVPVIRYAVSDGINNDTSTLTINVIPVSDLSDGNESVTTNENSPVSGNVLANAASSDGTPQVTGFTVANTSYSIGATASLEQGLLTLNSNGSYTFIPHNNFHGNVPAVTYTVSDGINTDTSSLTINVLEVNTPPVAADDTFSVNQGSFVEGNIIHHDDGDGVTDSDSDGNSLTITQINGANLIFDSNGDAEVDIEGGILSINRQGAFTYSNNGFILGDTPPSFEYTLSDGDSIDTAPVTINVLDSAPVANNDQNYLLLQGTDDGKASGGKASGGSIRGNIIGDNQASSGDQADSSPDGTVIFNRIHFDGSWYSFDGGNTSLLIETDYGKLTIAISGEYLFEPTEGMDMPTGRQELVFAYEIKDGDSNHPETDSATLTLVIIPDLTDANELVTTQEDTPVSGNLLANAISPNGTAQVTTFTVGITDFEPGEAAELEQGTLTVYSNGHYTFVPASNFYGDVPAVTYTVSDGSNTDTSTLTISVSKVNDAPEASDDSFSIHQGETVTGNVISHDDGDGITDRDIDGDLLSITQVNGRDLSFGADGYARVSIDEGWLYIKADGEFRYENSGFHLGTNPPSFDYTLSDGDMKDEATVTINVHDTAPVANYDINYLLLQAAGGGKAIAHSVRGNIIGSNQASSGDRADSSPDGTVIFSRIHFDGTWYAFDADNTSFEIPTEYGALTIHNSGEYVFEPIAIMDMPSENQLLIFDYEIEDGDNVYPEIDAATLTIDIRIPATLTFAKTAIETLELHEPLTQGHDSQPLLEQTLTDTTLIGVYVNDANGTIIDGPEGETHHQTLALSDILTQDQDNTLEQYLSAMAESEEDSVPSEQSSRQEDVEQIDSHQGLSTESAAFTGESLPTAPSVDELNSPDVLS
ncbi:Ig-like domain-containing protein [Thalassomonas actiniarum]|uniref:Tandem-95 repeat protein n=1 Tax=Thalassomonas actiniarum TaxID=485447 RepID=A0AAF0C4V2_9GAMM|nr:Ig-like domain-containing protein [Thalassomonas actiniarum]WDE02652.1 tandem-95 repeat protein [Thalassomonas actiniarum]